MKSSRAAIALLITLFFIMAITVAIGIGLKQLNQAAGYVENEKILLQTSMIFDDVLAMLKGANELDYLLDNNISGDDLYYFLSAYSIPGIPLGESGLIISVELKSARSKINVNTLVDNNITTDALREYLNFYMVNNIYADMLIDATSGIKLDDTYRTGLFYEKPYLYRDFIVSSEHLQEISDYYTNTYRDNNLAKANLDNLFSFSETKSNYKVDLNCASVEVLELLLGDKNRALSLIPDAEIGCSSFICNNLSDDEKTDLENLGATCKVQTFIEVAVEVMQDEQSAKISFEYDMSKKKGYNFVYEI